MRIFLVKHFARLGDRNHVPSTVRKKGRRRRSPLLRYVGAKRFRSVSRQPVANQCEAASDDFPSNEIVIETDPAVGQVHCLDRLLTCIWRSMGTSINIEPELPKKGPQPSERPVTARAAAEFLQMHVRSVTRLAGVGHIPGHPVGYGQRKKWLFYISELDDWLRAQVCSDSSRRRQGKGGQVA